MWWFPAGAVTLLGGRMSVGSARGPPNRGDQDAGQGEIDELTGQVPGRERGGIAAHGLAVAHGDDAVNVRDSCRSDLVFHAAGSYLDEGGGPCAIAAWGLMVPWLAHWPRTARGGERWSLMASPGRADRYCNRFACPHHTAKPRRPSAPDRQPRPTACDSVQGTHSRGPDGQAGPVPTAWLIASRIDPYRLGSHPGDDLGRSRLGTWEEQHEVRQTGRPRGGCGHCRQRMWCGNIDPAGGCARRRHHSQGREAHDRVLKRHLRRRRLARRGPEERRGDRHR